MTRTGGANRPPLALTMGDPAGIGGEITVAAWRALSSGNGPTFLAVDDPDRLASLGAPVAIVAQPDEAAEVFPRALPVLPTPLAEPAAPGAPIPVNAHAVIASIERAVALAEAGAVSAVVTNPINKRALYDGAGFAHPGHTEFLATLTGATRPVMMLASPALRVIPVTIHVSLAEACRQISQTLIQETIRIAETGLRRDFGIAEPRIAVAGLNPHAGEGGAMGREEIEIITPALEALQAEGLDVCGPLSADTLFHAAARATYDVAVCMTHDQALIPIKTLDFDRGVNVTLGLPIIRTSPDHGTAYDIAGTGRASPVSLIEALRLAAAMADARRGGAKP